MAITDGEIKLQNRLFDILRQYKCLKHDNMYEEYKEMIEIASSQSKKIVIKHLEMYMNQYKNRKRNKMLT